MKKIVMIHTSPVSLNDLKALVKQYMPDVELVNIIDDSLLEEVKKNNGPTPQIISRMNMYVQVANSLHPDLIFNQCSSVGEAFDVAKKSTTIPTLKIDEPMAKKAVEANKDVEVIEYLVDGALDILMKEKNVEKHNQLVLSKIEEASKACDVIVLAQGSMTAILPYIKNVDKPVLTSPELAIQTARDMIYGE